MLFIATLYNARTCFHFVVYLVVYLVFFLRKDPNTDFHPGLILLSAGVLSRKHFRLTVNDGVRRKASECMPLTTGKMNFYVLLT